MNVVARHVLFEGLFSIALRPTGQFARALKAAGFDLDRRHFEYPLEVWLACLDVAIMHAHAAESRQRALHLLGRQFMDGYLATVTGKVVGVALPFLPARRLVERIPRFLEAGFRGLECSVHWPEDTLAVVTLQNLPDDAGQMLVGIVTESLTRIGAQNVNVRSAPLSDRGCALTIGWK